MKVLQQFLLKPWFYALILILGISLKFYKLDYKIFWYDEISTVVQVAGAKTILEIDNSGENEIKNIKHYTGLLKHSQFKYPFQKELKKQWSNMNLNPLHYSFLSVWYRTVGDEYAHFRLFSVFVFLLTLPFLFFLSKELFQSNRSGWIAVSLYSVSPFIHLFAQEARYYIFWAFLLVTIHYFLIMAINHPKIIWWLLYVFFAVLSLYASLLSGFILIEHLLFVWIIKKPLRIKHTLALFVTLLLYLPWLLFVFANRTEVFESLAWHKYHLDLPLWGPLLGIVLGYVRTFSFFQNYTLFWDDVFGNISSAMIFETGINLIVLGIYIAAGVLLIRKSEKEKGWFILMLIIPGFLFFYTLDLIRNAVTSIWWRYYIFNTIPLILLVTYYISKNITDKKIAGFIIYSGLVILGVFSVLTISKYKYWYLGGEWEQEFVDNAALFSAAEKPLLVSDFTRANNPWTGPIHTMEVLVNCNSNVIDVLRVSPDVENVMKLIPANIYTDIFVFNASDELTKNLQKQAGNNMHCLEGRMGPPVWKLMITN